MRRYTSWLGRWSWRTVAVIVLAAAVTAVTGFWLLGSTEEAPPRHGDPAGCRQDPMAHVHHPARLKVLAECTTVSGIVRSVNLVRAYNDLKIVIAPDREYRGFLSDGNDGVLTVDVIATDLLRVPVPKPGAHITAAGAWVHNRADDAVELHPAYRIDVAADQRDTSATWATPAALGQGAELSVTAQAPKGTSIGEPVIVSVRAEWRGAGQRRPASQIHLFAELTTADGTGVRWQATRTNTLGTATVDILALEIPGQYTLTVYATPSGSDATATTGIRIARR
jgi:hypothetical protein